MVGPTVYLMRADSATVASVWARKTITKISDIAASRGASWATKPSIERRNRMLRAIALAPTRIGASAMRPCGAVVTLNIATTTATAAGHSLRAPMAMIGSGRRPLLDDSHAARNTAPAVITATRLIAARLPSRGSMHRLMISQVAIAAAVAGSRIQTPAVLMDANCARTL